MKSTEKYTTVTAPKMERPTSYDLSMNVEDLKDNRNEIISIISKHTTKVSEVMAYMVRNIAEATDIEKYTINCLIDLNLYTFTDMSDYNVEASKRQLGSSMR